MKIKAGKTYFNGFDFITSEDEKLLNKLFANSVKGYFRTSNFVADISFPKGEISIWDEDNIDDDLFSFDLEKLIKEAVEEYDDYPWDDDRTDLKKVRKIIKTFQVLEKKMEKAYEEWERERAKK